MCNKQITLTIPADSPEALEAARDFFDALTYAAARGTAAGEKLSEQTATELKSQVLDVVGIDESGDEPVPYGIPEISEKWTTSPISSIDPIKETELTVGTAVPASETTPAEPVTVSVSTETVTSDTARSMLPPEPQSPVAPATPATNVDTAPARTLPGVVIPWDERIHSRGRTKTANGCWTTKRQCPDDVLKQVEAELAGPVTQVTPASPDVAVAPTPVAPAASAAPVPNPAQTPAPTPAPQSNPAPAAPQTMADDPTKFTFQDLMATTNKLGYKDHQKILELGSLLRAWSNGQYQIIPEIALLPEVMHGFAQHIKQIHGVTE